jgi:hypothetical protein
LNKSSIFRNAIDDGLDGVMVKASTIIYESMIGKLSIAARRSIMNNIVFAKPDLEKD